MSYILDNVQMKNDKHKFLINRLLNSLILLTAKQTIK